MNGNRWHALAMLIMLSVAAVSAPAPAPAQSAETVGVVTEIKVGRGKVDVKPAGAADWRRVGPLAALRAGDAVRATEDASVVILLSGGRGTFKVDAAKSPFTVPAPAAGAGKLEKAGALVQAGIGYLATAPKEAPKAVLAVRSASRPPTVISPRNSTVFPDALVFEWMGNSFSRYTVRVLGPGGPVFEQKGVTGARLEYPLQAPRLEPRTRYTLQVQAGSQAPQEAWFEVVDGARGQTIRQDLEALDQALGASVSPSSLAAVKAGVLARDGLLHDARRTVLAALAKDPDEPTLHQLLGNLYLQSGLVGLGAESHDEAEFLLTRGAK